MVAMAFELGDYIAAVTTVYIKLHPFAPLGLDLSNQLGGPRWVARGRNDLVSSSLGGPGQGKAKARGAASNKPGELGSSHDEGNGNDKNTRTSTGLL